ncbi:MAG: hypothetical protein LBV43_04875, partial [Prevotella sp.]|nr:hypothetical protein [Prevotella sp.]
MRTKISGFVLLFILFFSFSFCIDIRAQVTIGNDAPPQRFSILEVVSTPSNVGGLRLPQLSNTERDAIDLELLANPEGSKGLLIFNTTTVQLEYWDGTQWVTAKTIEPWMVSGTDQVATLNTDNIYQMGHVTIGS